MLDDYCQNLNTLIRIRRGIISQSRANGKNPFVRFSLVKLVFYRIQLVLRGFDGIYRVCTEAEVVVTAIFVMRMKCVSKLLFFH